MIQKIHGRSSDIRYFWNVKTATGEKMEYRSRHSTPKGVRGQLSKSGIKVTSCTAARQ